MYGELPSRLTSARASSFSRSFTFFYSRVSTICSRTSSRRFWHKFGDKMCMDIEPWVASHGTVHSGPHGRAPGPGPPGESKSLTRVGVDRLPWSRSLAGEPLNGRHSPDFDRLDGGHAGDPRGLVTVPRACCISSTTVTRLGRIPAEPDSEPESSLSDSLLAAVFKLSVCCRGTGPRHASLDGTATP